MTKSPRSSLYALVIGINKYYNDKVPNLAGAVPDADAVCEFLTTRVGVAKDRIKNLRDEEATGQAIIDAIRDLAQNTVIGGQDPILIYYAGHGAEASPPLKWETSTANKKIQMLVPYDFDPEGSNGIHGRGVFDITLGRLLAHIATKKSNNITVIFDCCHSGSATRSHWQDLVPRGIHLTNYTFPEDISSLGKRATSIFGEYEKTGVNSHVLLAACMDDQTAWEKQGRGVFTSSLLTLLKEKNIHQLTYTDVIVHLELPQRLNQTPQCQGANQNRILFDFKVAISHRVYGIHAAPGEPGVFILEAGTAHGITRGTEFAVYRDESMTSPIGSVVAFGPALTTTHCSPIEDLDLPPHTSAFAVQTRIGEGQDLRLFIRTNDPYHGFVEQLIKEMQRARSNERTFRLINKDKEADFAISTRGNTVRFHIMDKICQHYGLTYMPFDDIGANDRDKLRSILHSAANFYWHLRHGSMPNNISNKYWADIVTVECFKLKQQQPGRLNDNLNPYLVRTGKNLNNNGIIFLDDVSGASDENHAASEPGTDYGYKITNISARPLYVAVFYFDISDLSIRECYSPRNIASKGQVEPSLHGKGSFTIGYGDTATEPLRYYIKQPQGQNRDVDVGFLKLYISTTYINHSDIPQGSPFELDTSSGTCLREARATTNRKKSEHFGVCTIPVIQRKREEGRSTIPFTKLFTRLFTSN